jgi:hypothetical protein
MGWKDYGASQRNEPENILSLLYDRRLLRSLTRKIDQVISFEMAGVSAGQPLFLV